MIGISVVHVIAFGLYWYAFTWAGLIAFFALHFFTGLGVTIGYHRMLTHEGFQTSEILRRLITVAGVLSGEAPPIWWVTKHRMHHQFSDKEGDPHSPNEGSFWSHMGWLLPARDMEHESAILRKYAMDLGRDKFMRSLTKWYGLWHLGLVVMLYLLGCFMDWSILSFTGLSLVVWGFFLRMVWVFHCTWFVNSAAHIWGSQRYETRDKSRNNWWVAFMTYGEGWHNNHHAFPRLVRHGHRWWEVDVSYYIIWTLKALGLVWDVQENDPRMKLE